MDYLDSEEMMTEYQRQILASGNRDLWITAIGDVTKAKEHCQGVAADTQATGGKSPTP